MRAAAEGVCSLLELGAKMSAALLSMLFDKAATILQPACI